ncbi:MAG: ornithine carbamoyltransferase [Acidobacteriota bacterium]|nr:MAG: ornithine carbamoyltransferase [Acidobacteriota bacterium]
MNLSNFLRDDDLSREGFFELFELAAEVKRTPGKFRAALEGRTLAMIFQKPSTRTRVSFEAGMAQLGGHALYLNPRDLQLGRGETIPDMARVLSRYVDAAMARVFAQEDVETLAEAASVPVVNGLSDLLHPCQALADFFTLREKLNKLEGLRVCYVGDGNNVAHSLMLAGAILGADVAVACPEGYEPDADIVKRAGELGAAPSSPDSSRGLRITHRVAEAVSEANVVYTDVWASMGQEAEHEERLKIFKDYSVTPDLMRKAKKGALFMHCLPAHRGEEVVDEVIDSDASIVWDQAENRLHTEKALLLKLLGAA